jgi:hypothetical protein
MSAPTITNAVSSTPKRSWRRFTLRALFLAVLAAAIFCGWVAYRARFLKNQYAWCKYNNRFFVDFSGRLRQSSSIAATLAACAN